MDDAIHKLKWADKRIHELEIRLDEFFNPPVGSKPYSIGKQRDSKTSEIRYYLTKRDSVPPDILLLSGDILQNLRTSLDYAMHALVGKASSTKTGFPIFDKAPISADDEAIFARKVHGARHEAINYIRTLKPYKGGNDSLWRLHELNIRDKHRLLFTAGIAMYRFNMGSYMRAAGLGRYGTDEWITPRQQVILHNVGDEILIHIPIPGKSEVDEDVKFEFQVALNEFGVAEGMPILAVIRDCYAWVLGTIADLRPYVP